MGSHAPGPKEGVGIHWASHLGTWERGWGEAMVSERGGGSKNRTHPSRPVL